MEYWIDGIFNLGWFIVYVVSLWKSLSEKEDYAKKSYYIGWSILAIVFMTA